MFSDYESIVAPWGYERKVWTYVGDYQGDIFALLYDPKDGQFGFIVIGYGSCSGCDSLQACQSEEDYTRLAESLRSAIRWYPEEGGAALGIASHDWEGQFYGSLTKEAKKFMEDVSGVVPVPEFSPDTLAMIRNPDTLHGALADSLQEDGFERFAQRVRTDENTVRNLRIMYGR